MSRVLEGELRSKNRRGLHRNRAPTGLQKGQTQIPGTFSKRNSGHGNLEKYSDVPANYRALVTTRPTKPAEQIEKPTILLKCKHGAVRHSGEGDSEPAFAAWSSLTKTPLMQKCNEKERVSLLNDFDKDLKNGNVSSSHTMVERNDKSVDKIILYSAKQKNKIKQDRKAKAAKKKKQQLKSWMLYQKQQNLSLPSQKKKGNSALPDRTLSKTGSKVAHLADLIYNNQDWRMQKPDGSSAVTKQQAACP